MAGQREGLNIFFNSDKIYISIAFLDIMGDFYLKIEDLRVTNPKDVKYPKFSLIKLVSNRGLSIVSKLGSQLEGALGHRLEEVGLHKLGPLDGVELARMANLYDNDYHNFDLIVFGEEGTNQMPKSQGSISYDGSTVIFQNGGYWGTLIGKLGSGKLDKIGGAGSLEAFESKILTSGDQIYIGHPKNIRRYRITIVRQ